MDTRTYVPCNKSRDSDAGTTSLDFSKRFSATRRVETILSTRVRDAHVSSVTLSCSNRLVHDPHVFARELQGPKSVIFLSERIERRRISDRPRTGTQLSQLVEKIILIHGLRFIVSVQFDLVREKVKREIARKTNYASQGCDAKTRPLVFTRVSRRHRLNDLFHRFDLKHGCF